jgi:predicted ATPase
MSGSVTAVKSKKGIAHIVFTGGPCGGKTTVLRMLDRKYHPAILKVPEYASFMIKKNKFSDERDLQAQVYSLYQNVHERASSGSWRGKKLIISDRGSLDGLAYYEDYFNLHQTSLEQEYLKYDLVVFFESISKISESFYSNQIDSRRTETFEVARNLDSKLYDIWKNHRGFVFVDNKSLDMNERFKVVDRIIKPYINMV